MRGGGGGKVRMREESPEVGSGRRGEGRWVGGAVGEGRGWEVMGVSVVWGKVAGVNDERMAGVLCV